MAIGVWASMFVHPLSTVVSIHPEIQPPPGTGTSSPTNIVIASRRSTVRSEYGDFQVSNDFRNSSNYKKSIAIGGNSPISNSSGREKRALASLVGRIELLTRANLQLELTDRQTAQLVELLVRISNDESMSNEEAKSNVEFIEELLSREQKALVDSISLPYSRSSSSSASGWGGASSRNSQTENPFALESNKKRLEELLKRLPIVPRSQEDL